MKYQAFIFAVFFALQSFAALAQDDHKSTDEKDALNQKDKQGRKQGHWSRKYRNGQVAYDVYFKDNKPIGEARRYFENGELHAILKYGTDSRTAEATLYNEDGDLIAEGFYEGYYETQSNGRKKWTYRKDSVWNYYKNDVMISEEKYKSGKKHGVCKQFFPNGALYESKTWKNGVEHGLWKKYYQNGKLMQETKFINGKLNGYFYIYTMSGTFDIRGQYKNGKKDGTWIYYRQGKRKIEYVDGIAVNQDEIDERETKKLEYQVNEKGQMERRNLKRFLENYGIEPSNYVREPQPVDPNNPVERKK